MPGIWAFLRQSSVCFRFLFLWDTGILFLPPGHSLLITFWALPVSHVETHFGTSAE